MSDQGALAGFASTPDLAAAVVAALWPSEAAALQMAARDLQARVGVAFSLAWGGLPALQAQLLRAVEAAVGKASTHAVVAAGLRGHGGPWPSWRDAVILLQRCGRGLRAGEGDALAPAVQAGDARAVAWLLEVRADPEAHVEGDLTPLRWAARAGRTSVVEQLLAYRANVNARGRYGYTALMAAAMHGRASTVDVLLAARAEVNTNGDGETAIDLAHRFPEIVSVLTRHVHAYGWVGERRGRAIQ
uniref:Ankyrin repeat domain-containing protein n=1 Tax=Alexandrium monilatum TaxID=311494 RepID=A0A7S4WAU9_9DINO